MSWVAVAAAAVSVVGTVISYTGSKKAAGSAKDAAKEEARVNKLTTAEAIRRLEIDERTLYGETLAGYAGGGVLSMQQTLANSSVMSGSPSTVIGEQSKEFAAEQKITQSVGASNVQQALTRGKATADAYKWQGYSNAAANISSIISSFKS